MAEYRKQIAYLDYLEDGVKIKNAGFVRIEEQNGHNRMEVKVKNLPGKDCGEFRLQEEHERTVGRISLQGGNGNCCMVWRMPEPGELDNSREESWQQTAQLRILLSGKRMLIANWHEPVEIPAQKETLQLQQQSQVQGDQSQQMEARSSQTNSPRQPGAGEIIPYPERRGSNVKTDIFQCFHLIVFDRKRLTDACNPYHWFHFYHSAFPASSQMPGFSVFGSVFRTVTHQPLSYHKQFGSVNIRCCRNCAYMRSFFKPICLICLYV